jgi:hypothetical protein
MERGMTLTVKVRYLLPGDYLLGSRRRVVEAGVVHSGVRAVTCVRDNGKHSYSTWRASTEMQVERQEEA